MSYVISCTSKNAVREEILIHMETGTYLKSKSNISLSKGNDQKYADKTYYDNQER